MKKSFFLFIATIVFVSCEYQDNGITSINEVITSDYLQAGDLDTYLENTQIVRFTGKPGISTISLGGADLSKYRPCFLLHVETGTTPETVASSAIIKLDGMEVLNTSDFSKNNGQFTFEICNLTSTSVLSAEMRGGPDSYLNIWIEGKISPFEGGVEVVKAGGSEWESANSVTVDGLGNTFITGAFQGSAQFGNSIISSAGLDDIFLAKYNSDFDLVWVKSVGGSYSEGGNSIALDNSGNIYITGYFSGVASFGNISLTGAGGMDGFIAKFDAYGNVVWAKQISTVANDECYSVKLDASGSPYVTGVFSGTAIFGNTSLTSDGGNDIFAAKLNPLNGDVEWAKKFGGANDQSGLSLSISSSGDIYLAGSFFVNADFGSKTLVASGGLDAFLAKLTSAGDLVWVNQLSGTEWENALSVALDGNENCYVAGYFTGKTDFGGTILTSSGLEDIFLAKYSPTGSLIWVRSAGSRTNYDNAKSVTTDGFGNIYITGYFSSTATFEGKTLISSNYSRDLFTAKYNSEGTMLWVKRAGGPDDENGNSIVLDPNGNVIVCGFFRGTETCTFGTTPIVGSGSDDIFLWRIWQ